MTARILGFGMLALLLTGPALGDNFVEAHYDRAKDQLVITMVYRGTNPDHQFSVQWGPCRDTQGGGHEISGEVLDSQFEDAARVTYRRTAHIDLASLPCRPVKATLRTAPRFYYAVSIPAAPAP